jgi:threonine aldolase
MTSTARYDFASDNVAGAMPEVIEALVAANAGTASGYGTDHVSAAAADRIRALLDADAQVRFTASGTAANAFALTVLARRTRRCWPMSTPTSAPTRPARPASSARAWA